MSILFGIEGKNKNNKKEINVKIENDKDIEDFQKIIDNIENNEVQKKKIDDLNIESNNEGRSTNYRNPNMSGRNIVTNSRYNKKKNNNYTNKINNNSNSLFFRSMNNNTASGSNSVITTIQGQNTIFDRYKRNQLIKSNKDIFKP